MLAFVPKPYWLGPEDEKAVYDLHRNDPKDEGYRKFLSRLSTPFSERLAPNRKGLDFGCGPGPALPFLFEAHGHAMDRYDPYYQNDPSVFGRTYDFICATEVVEHLRDPHKEFDQLFRMLKRGGWLGIMTKLVIDKDAFSRWHYIRNMTHVCFYCRETFQYLAKQFQADLVFLEKDVILFRNR